MTEISHINNQTLQENQIEEILRTAVSLFKRTGLTDLADKWDRILKTYLSKKNLH